MRLWGEWQFDGFSDWPATDSCYANRKGLERGRL